METRILLLPGMGDIYWVFIKLQDFCKKHDIIKPEIYTWEIQDHKFNRSKPYIDRVPFVKFGGAHKLPIDNNATFNSIYFDTTWHIENYQGYDHLLSFNGVLRNGYSLNDYGLGAYESDWYFPLTNSVIQEQAQKEYSVMDNYIVAFFSDDGMYSNNWLKNLPINKIQYILAKLNETTGYKIILTGGLWDKPFNQHLKSLDTTNCMLNMTGLTNLDQLFGLINESKGMIGWPGGNTIKSVYFKKPTTIIWSKYFTNSEFYGNCIPPDSIDKWHKIVNVEEFTPDEIVNNMITTMEWK